MSSIHEELRHFVETTSVHGLARAVTAKRHVGIRISWMLAFLLMIGTYLFLLSRSLLAYYEYPAVTNVEYLTVDELKFPSVTICNINAARASVVNENDLLKFLFRAPGFDENFPIDDYEVDFVETDQQAAHRATDMFLECSFEGQHQRPCNVTREITWAESPNGLCHTFNSAELIEEYGDKFSTRPGQLYGLTLLINIEQYEYLKPSSNASGIQVEVHDDHDLPGVTDKGFVVAPGTETLVAIKPTTIKRLPEPYAKEPNLCVDTAGDLHRNPLTYMHHYSLSSCRRQCRIEHQLKSCNCSNHKYGGINVTSCGYRDFFDCAVPAAGAFDSDPSILSACRCLPRCEETFYDVSVTSTTLPSDLQRETLVKSLNIPEITTENVEKNIIALKIFFGEMRYTMIEQQAQYSPTSLFGELGGQLGLCLGASVLTMCELLQLIVTMCAGILARSRDRKNKIIVVEEVKPPRM